MPNSGNDNESNDMEALALINEMSNILETKLDLESLAICYRLIEAGVNPLQLSKCVNHLKYQANNSSSNNSP